MLTNAAKNIAEKAKAQGMWLYDPEYKKWYSPEDFQHIFTYANASDEFLKTIQIRHPSEGIHAGFKMLVEVQAKLQALVNAVVAYYKK